MRVAFLVEGSREIHLEELDIPAVTPETRAVSIVLGTQASVDRVILLVRRGLAAEQHEIERGDRA